MEYYDFERRIDAFIEAVEAEWEELDESIQMTLMEEIINSLGEEYDMTDDEIWDYIE